MKILSFLLVYGISNCGYAATLLYQTAGSNTLAGYHDDYYLLSDLSIGTDYSSNPITKISVTLANYNVGFHAMNNVLAGVSVTAVRRSDLLGVNVNNDTQLLFDNSQIQSVTNVTQTADLFAATVTFNTPIDSLGSNYFVPFLKSVNQGYDSLTIGTFQMFFQNGSDTTVGFGIIPESNVSILVVFSTVHFCFLRRKIIKA